MDTEPQALIRALVAEALAPRQLELIGLSWRPGSRGRVTLAITVDRQGGVTLDDCAMASEAISALLDSRESLLPDRYFLEVSSPGAERVLRSEGEFQGALGRRLRVSLADGDRETVVEGRLVEVGPDSVVLEVRRPRSNRLQRLQLPRNQISMAQIIVDI